MKRTYVIITVLVVVIIAIAAALLMWAPGSNKSEQSTAPGYLRASNAAMGINLVWNNPSLNGTQYTEQRIYVHEEGKDGWQMVQTTFGSSESQLITEMLGGFVGGHTYTFRVTGVTNAGETNASNEVTITPFFGPDSPNDLKATWGNAYVMLTWQPPDGDGGKALDGYILHRHQQDSAYNYFDWKNYTLTGATTSFNDTNVTNGVVFYYDIAGTNEIGEGYSNSVQVKPGSPSMPLGLVAEPGNGYVLLSWSAPLNNGGSAITNYRVYRFQYSTQNTINMTVGSLTTQFNDSTVVNGATYQYSVKAENSLGGEGEGTGYVMAQPVAGPSPNEHRSWYPMVGDFVQYHVSHNTEMGLPDSTSRINVTSTSPPTTMTLNLTNGGFVYESVMERSSLFGGNFNGADFDIYNLPSYVTGNKVGSESYTTPWGTKTVEHWSFTNSGGGMTVTGNIWILNGVVLKLVSIDSGYTTTLVIEDTNIQHVRAP